MQQTTLIHTKLKIVLNKSVYSTNNPILNMQMGTVFIVYQGSPNWRQVRWCISKESTSRTVFCLLSMMSTILTSNIITTWKIVEKCPCCQVPLRQVIWKTAIWWTPMNWGSAKCQNTANKFSQLVLEWCSQRELLALKVLEIRFWWLAQVEAKYDPSLTFLIGIC